MAATVDCNYPRKFGCYLATAPFAQHHPEDGGDSTFEVSETKAVLTHSVTAVSIMLTSLSVSPTVLAQFRPARELRQTLLWRVLGQYSVHAILATYRYSHWVGGVPEDLDASRQTLPSQQVEHQHDPQAHLRELHCGVRRRSLAGTHGTWKRGDEQGSENCIAESEAITDGQTWHLETER